ncbi:hypothetical protein BHM03_00019878 [Ensete ventricosum]|nr:hypothetical protein BHM03_00019878 [Ensete ventricosum]
MRLVLALRDKPKLKHSIVIRGESQLRALRRLAVSWRPKLSWGSHLNKAESHSSFSLSYKSIPLRRYISLLLPTTSIGKRRRRTMGVTTVLSLAFFLLALVAFAGARQANFLQDFRITWAGTHIKQLQGGSAIQLMLDPSSGTSSHYRTAFSLRYSYALRGQLRLWVRFQQAVPLRTR